MQILREVVKEKDEYFLEAVEELIPLLILAQKYSEAEKLSIAIADRDRALSRYWLKFIRKNAHNMDEGAEADRTPKIEKFSFYELANIHRLEWEDFQGLVSDEEAYEAKEEVEEYLLSVFLTELALDRMNLRAQKEIKPIARAIWLRNLELTSRTNVTSWNATTIIEDGELEGSPKQIFKYVLQIAFPTPYLEEVREAGNYYGVPASLIYAVMKKESNFREDAFSSAGAVGLMQLMPTTASLYAEEIPANLRGLALTSPKKNIFLGAAYLKSMRGIFGEDYLALAGYNAGPGTVKRHIERLGALKKELAIETLPNKETEEFVKKVLKYAKIYEFLLEENGEK
jgi:soluble lytic murein transglycosylase-like protein